MGVFQRRKKERAIQMLPFTCLNCKGTGNNNTCILNCIVRKTYPAVGVPCQFEDFWNINSLYCNQYKNISYNSGTKTDNNI